MIFLARPAVETSAQGRHGTPGRRRGGRTAARFLFQIPFPMIDPVGVAVLLALYLLSGGAIAGLWFLCAGSANQRDFWVGLVFAVLVLLWPLGVLLLLAVIAWGASERFVQELRR